MTEPKIFQFKPFSSFVNQSFWHKLSEIKLDVDRLSDARREINGFYTNSDVTHCLLETDATSFNQEFKIRTCVHQCRGAIYNKNQINEFKSCDKQALINDEGKLIWADIMSGACLDDPSLLSRFFVLSFSDIKAFTYYYWFAYPCPSEPIAKEIESPTSITDKFSAEHLEALKKVYFSLSFEYRNFFILRKIPNDNQFEWLKLSDRINAKNKDDNFANANLDEIYFCFSDPSPFKEYAGWPLRLFILMLTHLCPKLRGKQIKILSIRVKKSISVDSSVLFTIEMPATDIDITNIKWIGWEPNNQGKYLPKNVHLNASMDPIILSQEGVLFNLKLMKWRLVPELDLNKNSSLKCLIFGTGTLGCSVSRSLIAWGVNNITFLDNGHVSTSNPVRQSLFTFKDAQEKKAKATAAAERLREIHPGVNSSGHKILIPMPGHTVSESLKEETTQALINIENLVKEHDVIFLLTDSRESRWLPTVLGVAYNKIVINAALGFDSYLVMRHGSNSIDNNDLTSVNVNGLKCIPGNRLGCYFCSDIVSPSDSMTNRTLDQQCTVTRPAVSNIAGSLAVELLIALIHHPLASSCPAYITFGNAQSDSATNATPEGILGIVPHSIRGWISNYEQIMPATERFNNCVACSKKIIDEYRKNGYDFLFKVFESSKCLEDISGISEILNAQFGEILEFDEDFEIDISD